MTGPAADGLPSVRFFIAAESLSPRERTVLEALSCGLSNQKIAERLRISASTVKWHLKNIYRTLGVRNRAQAVCQFRQGGWPHATPESQGAAVAAQSLDHACPAALIKGLSTGTSNKVLAAQLSLSRSTIKFHLKKLYRTLGTSNRIEAIQHIRRSGEHAWTGQKPRPADTATSASASMPHDAPYNQASC